MRRNLQNPQFIQINYEETINEDHDVGTPVATILGKDDDANNPNNLLNFEIPDTFNNRLAREYFSIDSDTGLVRLTKSLVNNAADIDPFTVSTYTLSVKNNTSLVTSCKDTELEFVFV